MRQRRKLRRDSSARPAGCFALSTMVSLLACADASRETAWTPPANASNLLFTEGAVPAQRAENANETAPAARGREWRIDRTFTGTIGPEGGQSRQRIRAVRERDGYTETFTSTTGPEGSTFRRRFQVNSESNGGVR